jgi:hypothetical protein
MMTPSDPPAIHLVGGDELVLVIRSGVECANFVAFTEGVVKRAVEVESSERDKVSVLYPFFQGNIGPIHPDKWYPSSVSMDPTAVVMDAHPDEGCCMVRYLTDQGSVAGSKFSGHG